jgi:hypothetical protein
MKSIVIAAIAGGLIVFFVSFIIHMATPLGTAGMKAIPNEDAVVDALRTNLTERAVYIYPGLDMRAKPSDEQQKARESKVRRGPSGLIIHTAAGNPTPFIVAELTGEVVAYLLAGFAIAKIVPPPVPQ